MSAAGVRDVELRPATARDERRGIGVAPDDPARRLYERLGFVEVGRSGEAWTMVRRPAERPR